MNFSETIFLLLMALVEHIGCNEPNEHSVKNVNKDKREVSLTKCMNTNDHNDMVTYPAEGCGYFRDPLEIFGKCLAVYVKCDHNRTAESPPVVVP